jgi:hypothetical protein
MTEKQSLIWSLFTISIHPVSFKRNTIGMWYSVLPCPTRQNHSRSWLNDNGIRAGRSSTTILGNKNTWWMCFWYNFLIQKSWVCSNVSNETSIFSSFLIIETKRVANKLWPPNSKYHKLLLVPNPNKFRKFLLTASIFIAWCYILTAFWTIRIRQWLLICHFSICR